MKKVIGQQGEVRITKIDAIPDWVGGRPIEKVVAGYVVSHSESGNYHILTDGEVIERTNDVPEGMRILYATLEHPQKLFQEGAIPHTTYTLDAGCYELRVSREYDPFSEQARRVVRRRDKWDGGIGFVTEDLALVG